MKTVLFCKDKGKVRAAQLANVTALLSEDEADRFINFYLTHGRIHPALSRKIYHAARQLASYRWGEALLYRNLEQSMRFIFDDISIDYYKVN